MPDPGQLLVRPFGYVEPNPVIRQLGVRDLYLGNVHAADGSRHDHDFEYVLSATDEPQPLTTHHHPLTDGPGNDWRRFAAAVDETRDLYNQDGALLVHCTAGISRSSTLLATALAMAEERSLHDALEIVRDARPLATPHPALHELAVTYLAANR